MDTRVSCLMNWLIFACSNHTSVEIFACFWFINRHNRVILVIYVRHSLRLHTPCTFSVITLNRWWNQLFWEKYAPQQHFFKKSALLSKAGVCGCYRVSKNTLYFHIMYSTYNTFSHVLSTLMFFTFPGKRKYLTEHKNPNMCLSFLVLFCFG